MREDTACIVYTGIIFAKGKTLTTIIRVQIQLLLFREVRFEKSPFEGGFRGMLL